MSSEFLNVLSVVAPHAYKALEGVFKLKQKLSSDEQLLLIAGVIAENTNHLGELVERLAEQNLLLNQKLDLLIARR